MNTDSISCSTCGGPMTKGPAGFGWVCPRCMVSSARSPDFCETSDGSVTANWSDLFPQLEVERTLRESDEGSAYLSRLVGEGPRKRVILQVLAGKALERAGGAAALISRSRSLAAASLPGVQPVIDFGDLSGAYYLITEAPDAPLVAESSALQTGNPDAINRLLSHLETRTRQLGTEARDSGFHLRFDPAFAFGDLDSGNLVFTPSLVTDETGPDQDCPESAVLELGAGQRLGVFTLEEQIGEGGFGEVWRSSQELPAERVVAVKVLKQGLRSARARARFDLEQQALARLDHPNIARLHEAGTAPGGRPFFAMEWVDGLTLTEYLRQKTPSLEIRLALFTQVCRAVEHAHQKGILHRDLKPSNILVAVDQATGEPQVKVIDFGIARALEEPLGDQTLLTRSFDMIGTPVYMSPEQTRGSADPDARTDVYGLGVVLYELLTGEYPFDPKLSQDELRRVILEEDPVRPSERVAHSQEARRIRGDLDWITLRCLEKDQDRRYASAGALLDDIERHRRNEPVEAGPPELSYRLGKYLRRHRIALSAAAIVFLALLAGGIAAAFGLLTAQDEKKKALEAAKTSQREAAVAQAVSDFLSKELLVMEESGGLLTPDPRNHNVTLRTVLERTADRIDGRFDEFPEVEGVIRKSLATSFLAVGDFEKAGEHSEKAVNLLISSRGEEDSRVLETMLLLASVRNAEGKIDDAKTLLERVARIAGNSPGELPATPLAMEASVKRGELLLGEGRILEAKDSFHTVLFMSETSLEPRTDIPANVRVAAQIGIARCSEHLEPRRLVLKNYELVVTTARKLLGERHPLTLEAIRRQCPVLGDQDQCSAEEATAFVHTWNALYEVQKQVLGLEHIETLRGKFDYFMIMGTVPLHAEEAHRELLSILGSAEKQFPADHPELLSFRLGLAIQDARNGDLQASADRLRSVIESGLRSVGDSHPLVVEATRELAVQTKKLSGPGEALSLSREAVTRACKAMSPAANGRRKSVLHLGNQLLSVEQETEAVMLYREEWVAAARVLGKEHRTTMEYFDRLLLCFDHDHTGGVADHLAVWALQRGGTPLPKIKKLVPLAIASQMALRPSFFSQLPIPLPKAYYRWLQLTSLDEKQVLPFLVKPGSNWRFLHQPFGKSPPANWTLGSCDDSNWSSGLAPLGFGEDRIVTELWKPGEGSPAPFSICLRQRFQAGKFDKDKPLLLRLDCDDAAIVFLNGKELMRFNLSPGPIGPKTKAARTVDDAKLRDYLVPVDSLVEGENLLAVQVYQISPRSSDLVFNLTLHSDAPLPLDCTKGLDVKATWKHVDDWLPDLCEPMEEDWRVQVECTTLASFGKWEEALELSQKLTTQRSPESLARLRWFQATALERLGREDEADALLRDAIPSRPEEATSQMINLTDFYNAHFHEAWDVHASGILHEPILKDFPIGLGSFGGVDFDARGILQLSGTFPQFDERVRVYPWTVKAIPIGQRVGKLHLLNAVLRDWEPEAVAAVTFHYEDGTTHQLPIRVATETLTVRFGTGKGPEDVTFGWRGPDPYRPGSEHGVFLASLTNPRLNQIVTSIDIESLPGKVGLLVAGITVEPPE